MPAPRAKKTSPKKKSSSKAKPKLPTASARKKPAPRTDDGAPIDGFVAKRPPALRPLREEPRSLREKTVPEGAVVDRVGHALVLERRREGVRPRRAQVGAPGSGEALGPRRRRTREGQGATARRRRGPAAGFASVDAYLAAQPERQSAVLEQVRRAICAALPEATERISYQQLATYSLATGVALYFSGWKKHYSLYPATRSLVKAFARELKPYKVVGSTLQLGFDVPVPARLIQRLARFRQRELLAAQKGKRPPAKQVRRKPSAAPRRRR